MSEEKVVLDDVFLARALFNACYNAADCVAQGVALNLTEKDSSPEGVLQVSVLLALPGKNNSHHEFLLVSVLAETSVMFHITEMRSEDSFSVRIAFSGDTAGDMDSFRRLAKCALEAGTFRSATDRDVADADAPAHPSSGGGTLH